MSEQELKIRSDLFARFDSMGETEVRLMDANPSGLPASEDIRYSSVWLALRDAEKRDAREERTLSKAAWANRIAIIAMVFATTMAIISILVQQTPCK